MDELKSRETLGKLMRINRLHRSVVESRMSELNVHRQQHIILMYLIKAPDGHSQKEIAEHFNISPAAIAVSLKKMEKSGLVERKNASYDSRVKLIFISEKGRDVIEKGNIIFRSIDENMFKNITDKEYLSLNSIFDSLIDNLLSLGAVETSPCIKNICSKKQNGRKQSVGKNKAVDQSD